MEGDSIIVLLAVVGSSVGLGVFVRWLDKRVHEKLHGMSVDMADMKNDTKRSRMTVLSMWQALSDWFKEQRK